MLVRWWWESDGNDLGSRSSSPDRAASDEGILEALDLIRDLGLVEQLGEGTPFVPTAFGHDAGLSFIHVGMQGGFLRAEARERLAS
ncbi:hypothetical protein [Ornithinimicrobium avium]|uniref:hypothetical protein n=1 Tax=Ornithinimicrobium avium TaxID=2283195 RepID=UPI0013B4104B|nr:hypothetical protein [Ornithinimicrobium avium]